MARPMQLLTGQQFYRLTVISYSHEERSATGRIIDQYWKCRCKCGNEVIRAAASLIKQTRANKRSCGKCNCQERWPNEYQSYRSMTARCTDKKHKAYKNYGGRGITICLSWSQDFLNFLADMGPRPDGFSLDRINNDGNYEPSNCKWSTKQEQEQNKRPYGTCK
jgi:hypothetical protein